MMAETLYFKLSIYNATTSYIVFVLVKLDNQRESAWQFCEGKNGEGNGYWWQCEENGKLVAPTLKEKLIWYEDDNPKQLMITLYNRA